MDKLFDRVCGLDVHKDYERTTPSSIAQCSYLSLLSLYHCKQGRLFTVRVILRNAFGPVKSLSCHL